MAQVKKIMVCLPENLLNEVDTIVEEEWRNRSEFIRAAMKMYIQKKRRSELRDLMIAGYVEMSKIDLELAEEGLISDNEALAKYESMLVNE